MEVADIHLDADRYHCGLSEFALTSYVIFPRFVNVTMRLQRTDLPRHLLLDYTRTNSCPSTAPLRCGIARVSRREAAQRARETRGRRCTQTCHQKMQQRLLTRAELYAWAENREKGKQMNSLGY